jgi:hypothetical protein
MAQTIESAAGNRPEAAPVRYPLAIPALAQCLPGSAGGNAAWRHALRKSGALPVHGPMDFVSSSPLHLQPDGIGASQPGLRSAMKRIRLHR